MVPLFPATLLEVAARIALLEAAAPDAGFKLRQLILWFRNINVDFWWWGLQGLWSDERSAVHFKHHAWLGSLSHLLSLMASGTFYFGSWAGIIARTGACSEQVWWCVSIKSRFQLQSSRLVHGYSGRGESDIANRAFYGTRVRVKSSTV